MGRFGTGRPRFGTACPLRSRQTRRCVLHDGSFTYVPGASFDGTDTFVYRAVFGTVSDQATVTLTACEGGPQVFSCWKEAAFLAKAASFGHPSFEEGFEDDAVWGLARSPNTIRESEELTAFSDQRPISSGMSNTRV